MKSNKLSLNYTKTKFMLIHKNKTISALNIHIDGNKIEQVRTYQYLGVTMDDKLTWIDHIKNVEKKISQVSGVIYKLRHYVDQDCLRTDYFSHVYFHLQYAVLAWGLTTHKNLKRLKILHRRLIRLMSLHGPLRDFNFSANKMFKTFNLLKFHNITTLLNIFNCLFSSNFEKKIKNPPKMTKKHHFS